MMRFSPKTAFRRPSPEEPIRIAMLVWPETTLSAATAPADVFLVPGVLAHRTAGAPLRPLFQVRSYAMEGGTVRFIGGFRLQVDGAYHQIGPGDADLVLIAPLVNFPGMASRLPPMVQWLQEMHRGGTPLASICTGAFLLAATGLLDGKTATTHWAAAAAFRAHYPKVRLKPQRLITDEGDLFCAGGAHAGMDLSLYLLERYCGRELAMEASRFLLHDPARRSQSPYALFQAQKQHGDELVLQAQTRLENQFERAQHIPSLAQGLGLSPRSFERRFKAATGDSPLRYLQRLRVEAAKRLLEQGSESFEQITFEVGYEDPASFRRLFTRESGLAPGQYRQRFASPLAGL